MEIAPDQNIRDFLVREWGEDVVIALEDLASQHEISLVELLRSTHIEELENIADHSDPSVA
ncbi:MAG: hypothetical protein AB3N63_15880 [Puniceicoccaceae bacterium]